MCTILRFRQKMLLILDALLFPAEECEQLLFWYLCQCDAEAEVRSLVSESKRRFSKPTDITSSLLLPLLLEAGRQWQNNLLNAIIGTDVALPYAERSVHLIAPCSDEETADLSSTLNDHAVTSPDAEPLYLLSCDEHMVCQVRWHPRGRSVAASCMDEGVRLWQLRERQFAEWPLSPDSIVPESLCNVFGHRDALRPPYVSLCWNVSKIAYPTLSPFFHLPSSHLKSEGTKFAVGMPNGFVTIRYENGKMFSSYSLHEGVIFDMCFSPNDGYLLSVGTDRTCYVLDVATGEPIQRCVGHQDAVTCCIWHNNETFVTCGADGHILIWHVDVSEPVDMLEGHNGCVNSIALSSDGDTLSSASDDGVVKLWSLTGRKSIGDLYRHEGPVLQVVFSPVTGSTSNILLASCSADSTVCLYDVTERRCLKRFTGHQSQVSTIDISPDGELLGSGDFNGILHIWNVKTLAAVMTYDANSMDGGTITCIQWNNDSNRIAVGTERGKVWHVFHVFLIKVQLPLF
ncbi:WD40 domain containing protein [Trichuris trichiura]|uniref:WD40 domain containing protein n=1 Tax=Trichuris trichiura TaxID=36087 RepID=A0A077Z6C2_TRITR|nr:WD40 domain containing protein [Trichuris trichiura]